MEIKTWLSALHIFPIKKYNDLIKVGSVTFANKAASTSLWWRLASSTFTFAEKLVALETLVACCCVLARCSRSWIKIQVFLNTWRFQRSWSVSGIWPYWGTRQLNCKEPPKTERRKAEREEIYGIIMSLCGLVRRLIYPTPSLDLFQSVTQALSIMLRALSLTTWKKK